MLAAEDAVGDELKLNAAPGSLRRRVLDAARTLLEESGADGLHLRTIAARVGNGVATLYHHFADKNALLAALAIEGWQELTRAIDQAMASGKFPHRIDAASRAFLTFIHRNPQLYALMQTEQALAANDAVRAAERAAFATFRTSFEGDDRVPAERVEEVSLTIWVLGRGIASAVLMQGEDDPGAAGRLVARVISGFAFLLSPRFAE